MGSRVRLLADMVSSPPQRRAKARREVVRAVRRHTVKVLDHSPSTSHKLIGLLSETTGGRTALSERHYPPAGKAMVDRDSSLLPVALVLVLDTSTKDAAAVIQQIVDVQLDTLGFRPLLVFNQPHLRLARLHGLVGELLMSESSWEQVAQTETWPNYATTRIRDLCETYRVTLTLVADGPKLGFRQELLLRSMRDGREPT